MEVHNKVSQAIKKGILVRPQICSSCKNESDVIEGHHSNYSKPLEVIWLCRDCHQELHKEMGTYVGRKKKTQDKKASETMVAYFTEEHKELCQKYCAKNGISFSLLVRQLLNEKGIL